MRKIIKYGVTGLVSFIFLLVIAVLALPQLIDPNLLKSQITKAVKDSTGRELTINGDIKWTFMPGFTLQVEQAQLSNPSHFADQMPFASIQKLELSVEIMPLLLSRKVIMHELVLDTANIHLTTLPNGQNNWRDLLASSANTTTTTTPTSTKDIQSDTLDFDIAEFHVANSHLIYNNQQRSERWEISKFNIDSTNISLDHAFPIAMNGKITHPPSDQIIEIDINAKATINPKIELYTLQTLKIGGNLKDAQHPQGQKINFAANELQYNAADKTFMLDRIALDALGSHASGSLKAHNSAQHPQITGSFKLDQLLLGKIKITHINLPINGQNGIYAFHPITAKLYGDNISANVTANVTGKVPHWQVSYQLSDIQVGAFLKDAYGYNNLSGIGKSNGQFTATGINSDSIIHSLTGSGEVQLTQGSLEGIDIAYWWQVGNRLLNKNIDLSGLTDTKKTQITRMHGAFTFNQGVGTTNNLQIYNDVIFVQAQGQIDLVKQYVNLTLNVSQSKNGQPTGTPIPLILSGNFGNIKIKPDEKTIAIMASKALAGKVGQAAVDKITEKAPEIKDSLTDVFNKLTGKSSSR